LKELDTKHTFLKNIKEPNKALFIIITHKIILPFTKISMKIIPGLSKIMKVTKYLIILKEIKSLMLNLILSLTNLYFLKKKPNSTLFYRTTPKILSKKECLQECLKKINL
jgi:hypothetical protein